MILLRRLLGDVLRERRREQGRTLREVSSAARVSLGYLSEVERGQKEASSELLASLCLALDAPLSDVLREVSSAARVSLGYLSEVERGQKEASSELLGSICEALDVPLSEVLREVSDNLALAESLPAAPAAVPVSGPTTLHAPTTTAATLTTVAA